MLDVEMAMHRYPIPEYPVSPDKEASMDNFTYPWVCYWVKSSTRRVGGCGCGIYYYTCLPMGNKYPH